MSNEGPGGAADAAFAQRAFPDSTISLAEMERARDAFAASKGRAFPKGKGKKGTWVSVGPSKALYPDSPVPELVPLCAERVRRGRPDDLDRDRRHVQAGELPGCTSRRRAAGSGRRRTAWPGRPTGSTWAARWGSTRPARSRSTRTTRPATRSTSAPARRTSAAPAASPASASTSRPTAETTWTGPLGGGATDTGNPLAGKGVGKILIKPGSPNTIYAATTTALRGMSESCCTGVTRPVPGAAKWGLYKSTNGGATWNFIHNGSVNAADCTGSLTEFNNGATCSPRGVRVAGIRPVQLGDPLRGLVRTRSVAVTRRRRDLDADQAVAERDDHPDAAQPGRHDAAERQHPHVRL